MRPSSRVPHDAGAMPPTNAQMSPSAAWSSNESATHFSSVRD